MRRLVLGGLIVVMLAACEEKKAPPPAPVVAKDEKPAKVHKGGDDKTEERPQEEIDIPLRVVIDGKELEDGWAMPELSKVKSTEENGKQVWSLREVVGALVGPKARIKTIVGQGGTRVDIDPKDWADAGKSPMLKINRQGQFKLQWAGNVPKDPAFKSELREVTKLEIVN